MMFASDLQVPDLLMKGVWPIISASVSVLCTILVFKYRMRVLQSELEALRRFDWLIKPLQRLHDSAVPAAAAGETVAPRRLISHQLLLLEDELKRGTEKGEEAAIDILGINVLGPLHQGRELLIRELIRGAKVRVLVLDPLSPTFARRAKDEEDAVGRLTAEWNASLYIVADIVKHVKSKRAVPNLEIRAHNVEPRLSLIMVNAKKNDGVILDNVYPPLLDTRGSAGHASVVRRDSENYAKYLSFFENTWRDGRPLDVISLPTPPLYTCMPAREPSRAEHDGALLRRAHAQGQPGQGA